MSNGKNMMKGTGAALALLAAAFICYWHFWHHAPPPPRKIPLTLSGVGILGWKNKDTGLFEVTRVYSNSPAAAAGVTKGMVVNKIDGVPAQAHTYGQLVKMLRGPAGTKVELEIIDTNGTTNDIELTRAAFINRIPRTPEEQAKREARAQQ